MVEHAYIDRRTTPPHGYYFLPGKKDLPLVFATRMSLSFPVLISAVPLYTIRCKAFYRREDDPLEVREDELQRNVFTDGGLSSNFPIHFFDAWLPSRPTFGINLTSWPKEAMDEDGNHMKSDRLSAPEADEETPRNGQADAVVMSPPNQPLPPVWQPVESMVQFFASTFHTMQNHRDNLQASLPGYRERIVHVRMRENEGGLNLDMNHTRVKDVMDRGYHAGKLLLEQFQFDEHRWVRFLTLMAALEAQCADGTDNSDDECRNQVLREIIEWERGRPDGTAYHRKHDWCDKAQRHAEALEALLVAWQKLNYFRTDCPRPEGVMRVTPKL